MWEEVGKGGGSRCERLHGKLDDGDRRDVQQLERVNNLQPPYEIVACQHAMPVLDTWINAISHRCQANPDLCKKYIRIILLIGRP